MQERNISSGNEAAFIEADLAFHTGVAQATKNTILIDLYQAFVRVHREGWTQANQIPGLNEQGQALHERNAEAIAQRDAEQAQSLTRLMLDQFTNRIQEILLDDCQTSA